jgi:hypothetical protein
MIDWKIVNDRLDQLKLEKSSFPQHTYIIHHVHSKVNCLLLFQRCPIATEHFRHCNYLQWNLDTKFVVGSIIRLSLKPIHLTSHSMLGQQLFNFLFDICLDLFRNLPTVPRIRCPRIRYPRIRYPSMGHTLVVVCTVNIPTIVTTNGTNFFMESYIGHCSSPSRYREDILPYFVLLVNVK